MSILHQKPDYARARPSTLIKSNVDYEGIFDTKIPIELYYKSIVIHEVVEIGLKKFNNPKLSRIQIGDIKFHVSMYVAARIVNKVKPYTKDISGLDLVLLTDELIAEAIEHVFLVYDMMGGNNSVAKGKEFVKEALEQIENNLQKIQHTK